MAYHTETLTRCKKIDFDAINIRRLTMTLRFMTKFVH